MEFSYQIIRLQHAAHVQCKRKVHGHGQAFGHGHDYQRDRHHKIVQHNSGHSQIVAAVPDSVCQNIVHQKNEKGQDGDGCTYLRNEAGQVV